MKKHIQKAKSSGKLKCEICGNKEILVEHHINGRKIPNANYPFNICMLCSNCHLSLHYGNIIIEKWVMTSNGPELIWHKKGEQGLTGEEAKPNLLIPSD